MTSEYFDSSLYPIPAGTARSSHVTTPLNAIDTGLEKLPTEAHLKRGTINYAVDSGSADALEVTLPYVPTAYSDGMNVVVKAAYSNATTTPTINVNGLGVISIKKADGTDPLAGDITQNHFIELRYNDTTGCFDIIGSLSGTSGTGTMASQNASSVNITGGSISNTIIYDADKDTYITMSADDIIDFMVAGTLVLRIESNEINLVSSGIVRTPRVTDGNGTTSVWVEKSPSEEKVRIDTDSVERAVFDSSGFDLQSGQILVDGSKVFGTFVDHSDGRPYLADTSSFDVSGTLSEGAWESIGPTGSGADNIWTSLGYVTAGADWVELEIKVTITRNTDPETLAVCSLSARKHGGSVGSGDSVVANAAAWGSSSRSNYDVTFTTRKIPLDSSRMIDLYWSSTGTTESITIRVIGFGYNNRSV